MNYPPVTKGFQIGLAVGQMVKHSTIVVTELQLRDYRRIHPEYGHEWEYGEVQGGEVHYVVRQLERFPLRTPYTQVIDRLKTIYHATKAKTNPVYGATGDEDRLAGRSPRPIQAGLHFETYVDVTDVGAPVADAIRQAELEVTRVTLSGGDKEQWQGYEVKLSNIVLISRMQFALQNKHIHLPNSTPDEIRQSQALVNELENFEVKVTDNANVRIGVFKEGAHGDLVISLALACWPMRDRFMHIEEVSASDPLWNTLFERR